MPKKKNRYMMRKYNAYNPFSNITFALRLTICLFFFTGVVSLSAQSFTEKWKLDSCGCTGFRSKMVTYDANKKLTYVNKLNLIGYTKEKLITLIGEPYQKSSVWLDENVQATYGYYLYDNNQCTDHSKPGVRLSFDLERGIVTEYHFDEIPNLNLDKIPCDGC
jgi:hypothetical protein